MSSSSRRLNRWAWVSLIAAIPLPLSGWGPLEVIGDIPGMLVSTRKGSECMDVTGVGPIRKAGYVVFPTNDDVSIELPLFGSFFHREVLRLWSTCDIHLEDVEATVDGDEIVFRIDAPEPFTFRMEQSELRALWWRGPLIVGDGRAVSPSGWRPVAMGVDAALLLGLAVVYRLASIRARRRDQAALECAVARQSIK